MWRARAIGRFRRAIDWLVVNQFPAIEGQQDRCRLVVSTIHHVIYGALMLISGNKTPSRACCDVAILRARYGVL